MSTSNEPIPAGALYKLGAQFQSPEPKIAAPAKLKRPARRVSMHGVAPVPFVRLPGSRSPFKRAIACIEQIQQVLGSGLKLLETRVALDALPEYRSRGHGGRHKPKHRLNFEDRSKYVPSVCFHEGKR